MIKLVKNKYKVERNYITNTKARSKQRNNVKFLVSHETANNNAGADNHFQYFNNITFQASAHTFIDDKKILEIIPLNEKAWHVQYNQDKRVLGLGYANDNAIGIELCRPGNFKQAYDRYVWYHAYLCKKFGLQPKKHIIQHSKLDPARRSDPESWLNPNGVTWNKFIKDVQKYYDNWDKDNSKPNNKLYRVQIGAYKQKVNADLQAKRAKDKGFDTYILHEKGLYKVQIGAYSKLENAEKQANKAKKAGFDVYIENAKQNTSSQKSTPKPTTPKPKVFKVGQKVKIKSSAKKYSRSNVTIPSKYKNKSYTIQQVGKDDVLIKELYSWVRKADTY